MNREIEENEEWVYKTFKHPVLWRETDPCESMDWCYILNWESLWDSRGRVTQHFYEKELLALGFEEVI